MTIIERAFALVRSMPPAISGSGGHTATFNAATALTRGLALSVEDALAPMLAYNATCLPPWTESDLRHKLRNAAVSSSKPVGYLLGESIQPHRSYTPDNESEGEKKARQRRAWPEFKTLKPAGIEAIATLRHMLPDAVDLAHQHGLLKGAEIDGHKCFIIHEGTFAQARRFDGLPLTMQDGTESKPKTLLGSQGAFIGQRLLGNTSHVLLVEGVVGLVEALAAFLLAEDVKKNWSVIAAVSAYSRFRRDPALLSRLAGRHVRIVPDNDEKGTGLDAAASWLADMENAGATVDAIKLPPECKDLGPIVSDPLRYKTFLTSLFQ